MPNSSYYSRTNHAVPPTVIYTVKMNIPYLDVVFCDIPDKLIGLFLETTLSILIARYSRWGNNVSMERFIELTDDFEESITQECIQEAILYEMQVNHIPSSSPLLLDKEESYYFSIENILDHYKEYFIESQRVNDGDAIEFLIATFEKYGKVKFTKFNYIVESSDLYLFIPD